MFALRPNPIFKFPATIQTVDGSVEVTFLFKHKGRKALRAFYDSLGEGEKARTDTEAIGELVAGWEGVDTEFSIEALDTLLDNYPSAAKNIFEAYNKGLFEGRQKNS
jgi:hypothetical protein